MELISGLFLSDTNSVDLDFAHDFEEETLEILFSGHRAFSSFSTHRSHSQNYGPSKHYCGLDNEDITASCI